jgi:hypothetical protein
MVRALILLAVAGTAGCAPMLYGPGHMGPPRGVFAPPSRPMAAHGSPWESVVGRWDNVVALNPTAPVGIVTADGTLRAGRFLRAGTSFVRILENGVEVDLPRGDVARLDLLKSAEGIDSAAVVRDAARGAAITGGLMMAVPYLITGRVYVPPARLWVAGAVAGGAASYQQQRFARAERTVYISPDLIGR